MNNKIVRRALAVLAALAFWLLVWEILSRAIGLTFALPGPAATFRAFFRLLGTGIFWATVGMSFLRILAGFLLGAAAGILLGAGAYLFLPVRVLFTPMMTVIRSTPVASVILLLWILIGRASVPTAIALLMVMPVVYQNIYGALGAQDKALREVLTVFRVPFFRRLRIYVIPFVLSYAAPAFLTASGLAWKAGIAAEIIAYTKNSIGQKICDAKTFFEGEEMYAWTLAVILLSLLLEFLISLPGRRKRGSSHADM